MKLHEYTVQAILELYGEYKKTFRDEDETLSLKALDYDQLMSTLRDPNRRKLVSLIDNLDPDVRAELIAVMWIGRGDGNANDFEKLKQHAIDTTDQGDAEYVVS